MWSAAHAPITRQVCGIARVEPPLHRSHKVVPGQRLILLMELNPMSVVEPEEDDERTAVAKRCRSGCDGFRCE